MKNLITGVLLVFTCLLASCKSDRTQVDVSEVVIESININRLEQDVFTMDTANIAAATQKLEKKYGSFYKAYIKGIINNGGIQDSSYVFRMKSFIRDKDMREAYASTQRIFPDPLFLTDEFNDAFKHFNYHFPKRKLPRVVTMMSGFNYSTIMVDSTLAIGLEMYLGKDNTFYKMLTMPYYKVLFMNKENITTDALRTWMFSEFPYNLNKNDFLSEIIYLGKIMYLNDAMLPDVSDTLKMQYTQKQMDYCTQNEFNVWTYFIAQKLVYTTDHAEILKFTGEGPFTSAFSKESPPRIGYWIGWQIVRQYMKNNPDVSLEQLMQEEDAQKILTKSKYKPQK